MHLSPNPLKTNRYYMEDGWYKKLPTPERESLAEPYCRKGYFL